ncbi:MAG: hypothetical protein OXC46_06225 [Thaumarchaeota archaeon]|nr:hypothetical protein [Nitrososphaerota archaeon]
MADDSVTVSGNVENIVEWIVDYTIIIYENEEKSLHEDYVKSAQRLEIYYKLVITLILIPAMLFRLWMKRKPKTI